MTPKEKAKELIDKFARIDGYQDSIDLSKCEYEKQCALIAVDEIIKETKLHDKTIYQHGRTFYWQEVKQEIEELLLELVDDDLEKIADDYAIEFALFLSKECETNGDKDGWWFYNKNWKTTNELLEIFKKEKCL